MRGKLHPDIYKKVNHSTVFSKAFSIFPIDSLIKKCSPEDACGHSCAIFIQDEAWRQQSLHTIEGHIIYEIV